MCLIFSKKSLHVPNWPCAYKKMSVKCSYKKVLIKNEYDVMFLSYFRNLRTFGEKKYLQEVLTFFGETYFLRSYKKN